jgi:hypothetical protein
MSHEWVGFRFRPIVASSYDTATLTDRASVTCFSSTRPALRDADAEDAVYVTKV